MMQEAQKLCQLAIIIKSYKSYTNKKKLIQICQNLLMQSFICFIKKRIKNKRKPNSH